MKIKLFLILTISIITSLLKAQDYEIISVEPANLIPGTENHFEIVLNKKLSDGDSLYHYEILALDDQGQTEEIYYINLDEYFRDSVILASTYIPEYRVHNNCFLLLEIYSWDIHFALTIDSVIYEDLTIGAGITGIKPEICMVSADSSNMNMVIWEPVNNDFLDSVVIYKETAVNDEFEIIGKKFIEESSVFVDEGSENTPNSNRYKIAYLDTAGILSNLSDPHKTLHLMMSPGINGSINLIWEKYEGFEYATFHIYRGPSKDEMMKIAELASNIFTYSDLAPPLGALYYQVVIERMAPCDITQEKSSDNIFSSTKSNIVEYSVVSNEVVKNSGQSLYVYPNPVSEFLNISIENSPVEIYDVEIHDLTGRSVQNYSSVSNGSKIDLSNLKSGMYMLTIRYNGANQNKLIVKE